MSKFKFSVGPWNVHTGADSYGPATRTEPGLDEKFKNFKALGFDAVQFHDDDAVPEINNYSVEEIKANAGIDIGGTLIGMHLKKVAVPVKLKQNKIGKANVLAARTRAKFIGGDRAIYDEKLK